MFVFLSKYRHFYLGLIIVSLLSLLKLGIHLWAANQYGFHRDELLHLAASEHLAWGYMEFPPFIAFLGYISQSIFGNELWSIRILPALVGFAIIWLTYGMVREMGGKLFAQILAVICILTSVAYYRNHTLFQPVAFDQLFWVLAFYFFIKYINTRSNLFLLWIGVVVGLGLLNKYTMFFWLAGMGIALFFTPYNKLLNHRWTWYALLIAFLIFLPNLIWQYQHDFPVLGHAKGLYESQFNQLDYQDFLVSQFWGMHPATFPIWFSGLLYFLVVDRKSEVDSDFYSTFRLKRNIARIYTLRPFQVLAIAYLAILGLFLVLKGKGYYLFSFYPVFFAGGAVAIERLTSLKYPSIQKQLFSQLLRIILITSLVVLGTLWMPFGTPFLPIETFIKYADLKQNADGRYEDLTDDYADMFGWEEQVQLVANVYHSLPENEKSTAIIWAENYGEASAIQILGKKHNLPAPICFSGSFYHWSHVDKEGEVFITIGLEVDFMKEVFEKVEVVQLIRHPLAIAEENGIPLCICRKPKKPIKEFWKTFEQYIFS